MDTQKFTSWKLHCENKLTFKNIIGRRVKRNIYFPLQGEKLKKNTQMALRDMPAEFVQIYGFIKLQAKRTRRIFANTNLDDPITIYSQMFPDVFFGPRRHRKHFLKLIQLIITRSMHECIFTSDLHVGIKYNEVPWLNDVCEADKRRTYTRGIRIILNDVIIPLHSKIFHKVPMGQIYELKFIPMTLWLRYLQKVTVIMVQNKYLTAIKYSPQRAKRVRGVLTIKPKGSIDDYSNFRPYIRVYVRNNKLSRNEKMYFNRCIYKYANELCPTKVNDLHKYWKSYVENVNGQQIYGAKVDLTDCFGNIDRGLLIEILNRGKLYRMPADVIKYLVQRVQNQLIYFGTERNGTTKRSKIWEWNHGLLQGERFSAPLCELYMSYLDGNFLSIFNKPGCFLHRKVDDYFFCSTRKEDIISFLEVIRTHSKLNELKTQSNVCAPKTNSITYCGFVFNLNTKEVETSYHFKKGTQLHQRFKLWNPESQLAQQGLLAKAMYFPYNNHHFSRVILNLDYNSVNTVLNNFYKAMVFLAFKYECTAMAISRRKPSIAWKQFYEEFLSRTVYYYATKCLMLLKGADSCGVSLNILIKIGYLAFVSVLRKRQIEVYNCIIKDIKEKLKTIYTEDYDLSRFWKLPHCFENICMKRVYSSFSL